MASSNDKAFIGSALAVLGVLVALFVGIIVLAGKIGGGKDGDPKLAQQLVDERTAPIAKVATDASQIIKAPVVAHVAKTGDQIVTEVCSACHATGTLGAPKIGDKAEWEKRKAASGGFDGLANHAIHGFNQMPAKGGNPDLSDDEMHSAVANLLRKAGL